jgi:hypothetical protein
MRRDAAGRYGEFAKPARRLPVPRGGEITCNESAKRIYATQRMRDFETVKPFLMNVAHKKGAEVSYRAA